MFEFTSNSQPVESLKELQLNYNTLKQLSEPLKCRLINKCHLINPEKISEIFNMYLAKLQLQRSLEEKNKSTIIRNSKNEDGNESYRSNKADQILQICTIDPSSENLSDNALSDLFTCEVQNSKNNSTFLRETLTDLSIANDVRTNCGNSLYRRRNVQNLMGSTTVEQNILENSRTEKPKTPRNNANVATVKEDGNLSSQHQITEKSAEDFKSVNITTPETNCDIKRINIKNTSNSRRNTPTSKSPSGSTDRPYSCSRCTMAFKRNLHLKRHFLVTHTLNKNFVCDTCGKSFSRKDYLDKHTVGHQKKNFKLKLLEQGIVVRTKMYSKSNTEKLK